MTHLAVGICASAHIFLGALSYTTGVHCKNACGGRPERGPGRPLQCKPRPPAPRLHELHPQASRPSDARRRDALSHKMAPFSTPPGSGGSSSLHRQGSASTMQRMREEKERINQLRATLRKDAQARPPAPSQSENASKRDSQLDSDGEGSSSQRSATRIRIDSVSTPQQHAPQPVASPQPDATQESGFGSCTLACKTASLGCGLLAFAEWMDGHTLQGLALTLLALACMCAASGVSSQLAARTKPHDVHVAAVSLL